MRKLAAIVFVLSSILLPVCQAQTRITGPTIIQSGGGGTDADAVHYNPTTTAYIILSSSVTTDDFGGLSGPSITAGAWSADGTTGTVNTTTAHGLTTGDWVKVLGLTGWFSPQTNRSSYDTGQGVFQVTVTSPTQFTFSYSTNTGSGTGGTINSANYWAAYQLANMPFIKGHGSLSQVGSTLADANTYFSSKVNCSLGTPTYLILQIGQADIAVNSNSAYTVEQNFKSVWTQAHAAGCVVVQGAILPTSFGLYDGDTARGTIAAVNTWLELQAKSSSGASGGAYWDRWIEFGSDLYASNNLVANTASGAHAFATYVNRAYATQEGDHTGHLPFWNAWTNGLAYDSSLTFLDSSYNPTVTVYPSSSSLLLGLYYPVYNTPHMYVGTDVAGGGGPSNTYDFQFLIDDSNTQTIFGTNSRMPVEKWGPNAAVTAFQRMMFNKTTFRWCPKNSDNGISNCTTGLSRYADGTLSFDGPNFNDGLGSARLYSVFATATAAPTGSCSTNGQWVPAVDGSLTRCLSGTWTTFSGGSSSFALSTTGTSGPATYTGGVLNIPVYSGGSSSAIHTMIAVGTTSVPAGGCLPTRTTYSTATMTGVTTSMTFSFTWSTDYSAVSGWTPSTPGLYFTSYPTANTLNYQVCNATSTAIVPGSSTTWNVSAQ
jgi:hypothetical protein